jgi:hypothetical protein
MLNIVQQVISNGLVINANLGKMITVLLLLHVLSASGHYHVNRQETKCHFDLSLGVPLLQGYCPEPAGEITFAEWGLVLLF